MITTRSVIAIMAIVPLVGGMIAHHRERAVLSAWLMVIGLALSTFWAGLSVAWAQNNPSAMSVDNWLALTTMGIALTIYFGYRARNLTRLM
jgi:hypothetical protein